MVGYFHGRPQVKSWIISKEDLDSMYTNTGGKEILLWCDGKSPAVVHSSKRKRKKQDDAEEHSSAKRYSGSCASDEEQKISKARS